MKNLISIVVLLLMLATQNKAQTVTDIDGNVYDTVVIGKQVWMKQNLKVTRYNNGTLIPIIKDSLLWTNNTTGARCYYNNDSSTNNFIYGALYNWYAVNNTNKISPTGWHVSTETEWIAAENFLGGDSIAGGKMKEVGTTHWTSPNVDATNSSRFTGLPGGCRSFNASYQFFRDNGLWWTATERDANWAMSLYFWNQFGGVDHNPGSKKYGFSVRCVRDLAFNGINELNLYDKIKLYPNPATEKISIEYTSNQEVQVDMYNLIGECVYQNKLLSDNKSVDITSLTKGIYTVIVSCPDWNKKMRLIKE